jgi:solute carrier family 25 uncoupling protein 27
MSSSDELLTRWGLAAAASIVSEACTYPLDMIKTRLQLQNELGKGLTPGGHAAAAPTRPPVLLSYRELTAQIVRTEGARALYAGASVAIFRQCINAGVSVSLYPTVRAALQAPGESAADVALWKRALAGSVTGALGQGLANPADVIKVRVQADGRLRLQGREPRYKGALDATRVIWRTEGIAGFFAAFGSSVWRAAIINAAGIAAYDRTKQAVGQYMDASAPAGSRPPSVDSIAPQLVGAFVAGAVTAVVTTPLDVVKTRLMNDPRAYKGPNDALAQLLRTEGLASMYKGFIPTYKRQGLFNLIFWLALEELQKLTGQERI